MAASREISALRPGTQAKAISFIRLCKLAGIDVIVTCTLRSAVEQEALYARGRTTDGPIVTYAKPGTSLHETGRAFDVVPLRHGKPVWGTTGVDLALWQQIGAYGEQTGLEWGGHWTSRFRDYPHFQDADNG